MLRWLLVGFLAVATFPALAQETSIFDGYAAARDIFADGHADPVDYLLEYRTGLFDGLEGAWFQIGALRPDADDPARFAQECADRPVTIAVRDGYSFDVTIARGEGPVTTRYSSRGGSVFGSYTDPAEYIHSLNLDQPDSDPTLMLNPLNSINGLATIHRPSPDILVIQTNYGVPAIYGRCPE